MTAASVAATLSVEAGWAEAAPVCRLRGGPAAAAQLGHQSMLQITKVAALSEIAAKRAGRAGCHQHVTTTQDEPNKKEMEDTRQSRAQRMARCRTEDGRTGVPCKDRRRQGPGREEQAAARTRKMQEGRVICFSLRGGGGRPLNLLDFARTPPSN
jgi:hypothetical protein